VVSYIKVRTQAERVRQQSANDRRGNVTQNFGKFHCEKSHGLYNSPNIITAIKSRFNK
jgi:hypothetical protein